MSRIYRVALMLPKGHEYASRLIEGVVSFVHDHPGFEFVEVPYDESRTPAAAYHVDVDGALVWAHHASPWVLDLRDRGMILVSFNGEWRDEGIPCVSMDMTAILDRVVEHLAGLKYPHSAYVGHVTASSPAKMGWRDGFLERACGRGWTAAALDIPGIPSEERQRLAAPEQEGELIEFLRDLPKPLAIFCDDDYVGVLICRVAEHLGLAVPGDVAVLGFFDLAIARFSSPTLSSLPAPGQLVGSAGMQLMSDLLRGSQPAETCIQITPPPVVQRESTGGITVRNDDIRRAYQMIERHACDGLTVTQLLERLAISQKTLNKRFAAVYGCTPGEELRRVRLQRARQWLTTTDLSVGRIASMCGFDDPSNFNLFFKRETGCTPTEYRKQQR